MVAKISCEGVNKRCGATYGVHAYEVRMGSGAVTRHNLCVGCAGLMEHGGYTIKQLADVPVERKPPAPTQTKGKSSPEAWMKWVNGDGE
jgi:hypothetical protein